MSLLFDTLRNTCNVGKGPIGFIKQFIPLPNMPILGSSNSAANKDMMSKI